MANIEIIDRIGKAGQPQNITFNYTTLDSHPLPTNAWLGGLTTLPYQYSNEPEHRFKQMAGNISPTNGQPFMLGRRLHHTDFGNGEHSEPGNPVFTPHVGKLGPKFIARSCVECHTPDMVTGPHHPMTELRNQTIHPYTDLLLHDMGPGLADNMGEGGASGSEWRTPPLWGIGLSAGVNGGEAYLHDGRARTPEEAILWHSGEAEASKEAFRTLPTADRAALIRFLKSL